MTGVADDCRLLAQALRSYGVDGQAHAVLPLLRAAQDPLDAPMMPGLAQKVQAVGAAVEANAAFLADALVACGLEQWEAEARPRKRLRREGDAAPAAAAAAAAAVDEREQHREDVRCVLRQVAREWSAEGAAERQRTHTAVLEALAKHLPPCARPATSPFTFPGSGRSLSALVSALRGTGESRATTRTGGAAGSAPTLVLVPGAGLGRLAAEIQARGYAVQACEAGSVMSAVGAHLHHLPPTKSYLLHPFVHDQANRRQPLDHARAVAVPDVAPASLLPSGSKWSTVVADFVDEYARPEHAAAWDALVSCFFLDTASNPLAYIRTAAHCVRPGGIWVNTGPLLWHHAASAPYDSLQLSAAELLVAADKAGFQLLHEATLEKVGYCGDERSMMCTEFETPLWVLKRRAEG